MANDGDNKGRFQFQVQVEEERECGHGVDLVWRSVRPTGGHPYEYNTYKEAYEMGLMWCKEVGFRVIGV